MVTNEKEMAGPSAMGTSNGFLKWTCIGPTKKKK
jgi:cytochrome c biogenesis protein CcdA